MFKYLTVGLNLLGGAVWMFNFVLFNSFLYFGIGLGQIFIAVLLLRLEKKYDKL